MENPIKGHGEALPVHCDDNLRRAIDALEETIIAAHSAFDVLDILLQDVGGVIGLSRLHGARCCAADILRERLAQVSADHADIVSLARGKGSLPTSTTTHEEVSA
jgi:hypothetical protein